MPRAEPGGRSDKETPAAHEYDDAWAPSPRRCAYGITEDTVWGVLVVVWCCAVGFGTWKAMFAWYFGSRQQCQDSSFDTISSSAIETVIGALPIWSRNLLLSEAVFKVLGIKRRGVTGLATACLLGAGLALWSFDTSSWPKALLVVGGSIVATLCIFVIRERCHKATGFDEGEGLVGALFLGRASRAGHAEHAGWLAIVGQNDGAASDSGAASEPQSTWEEARETRRLTKRQAAASAIAKLFLWHWSQPFVYLWVFRAYRCYVASLGAMQQYLGTLVAAREIVYIACTVVALHACPVFLLLDPVTVWNEEESKTKRCMRVAAYVLTPHNYVALCLANRFRGRSTNFLLGLVAIQVVADLASCIALGALLAGGASGQQSPTALLIGYTITAAGFGFFFGPLSVVTSFSAALDGTKQRCARFGSALAGVSLLACLLYISVCFVLLGAGVDIFCDGIVLFQADPCNHHGQCYSAAMCHCNPGFGPEISYGGQSLCLEPGMACTADQLARNQPHASEICCSGHGAITNIGKYSTDSGSSATMGCRCELGFGPEQLDDVLTPSTRLCSTNHTICSDGQIGLAVADNRSISCRELCCGGHGTCVNRPKNFHGPPGPGCACDSGYGGHRCETLVCTALEKEQRCAAHGTCEVVGETSHRSGKTTWVSHCALVAICSIV
eukprot:COSAG04_NODE_1185_length_7876_cov_15.856629_3_plen_671_part_00